MSNVIYTSTKDIEQLFKDIGKIIDEEEKFPEDYFELATKGIWKSFKVAFDRHASNYKDAIRLKKYSNQLDWEIVTKTFNNEFNEIWNKITIQKQIEKLDSVKITFYISLQEAIFYRIFTDLYDIFIAFYPERNKEGFSWNQKILDNLPAMMRLNFEAIDFLLTLTTLNENNASKIIRDKFNNLQKKAERSENFEGKEFREEDIPLFKEIKKIYRERHLNGEKPSYREIAFNVYQKTKRSEANYKRYQDDNRENFYKRFLRAKKHLDKLFNE